MLHMSTLNDALNMGFRSFCIDMVSAARLSLEQISGSEPS